jgi:hypothetical protein
MTIYILQEFIMHTVSFCLVSGRLRLAESRALFIARFLPLDNLLHFVEFLIPPKIFAKCARSLLGLLFTKDFFFKLKD